MVQFMKDGCTRFVITDIVEKKLKETEQLAKEIDPNVGIECVLGDITSETVANEIVQRTVERYGRLDYAVNCAGITGTGLNTDATPSADYQKVMEVNIDAMFLCERAQIRAMLKQDLVDGYTTSICRALKFRHRGSIINVSSIMGSLGGPRATPYVISKHAVLGLTRADGVTYAPQGIRVNCVSPGYSLLFLH